MGLGQPLTDAQGKPTGKFTDTHQLRSVLVDVMKDEVEKFCNPSIAKNWELSAHSQVLCCRGYKSAHIALHNHKTTVFNGLKMMHCVCLSSS